MLENYIDRYNFLMSDDDDENPSVICADIEFEFPTSSKIVNGTKNTYNYGLLSEDPAYSASTYLMHQNEPARSLLLERFKTILKKFQRVSKDAQGQPWYFKSISGVGELLKIDKENGARLGEDGVELSIKTLDNLGHRVAYLKHLFRQFAWSEKRMVHMLPSNMREFSMVITVREMNQINYRTAEEKELYDKLHIRSFTRFKCKKCEFMFLDEPTGWYGDISNEEGTEAVEDEIKIKVKDVEIEFNNELMNDKLPNDLLTAVDNDPDGLSDIPDDAKPVPMPDIIDNDIFADAQRYKASHTFEPANKEYFIDPTTLLQDIHNFKNVKFNQYGKGGLNDAFSKLVDDSKSYAKKTFDNVKDKATSIANGEFSLSDVQTLFSTASGLLSRPEMDVVVDTNFSSIELETNKELGNIDGIKLEEPEQVQREELLPEMPEEKTQPFENIDLESPEEEKIDELTLDLGEEQNLQVEDIELGPDYDAGQVEDIDFESNVPNEQVSGIDLESNAPNVQVSDVDLESNVSNEQVSGIDLESNAPNEQVSNVDFDFNEKDNGISDIGLELAEQNLQLSDVGLEHNEEKLELGTVALDARTEENSISGIELDEGEDSLGIVDTSIDMGVEDKSAVGSIDLDMHSPEIGLSDIALETQENKEKLSDINLEQSENKESINSIELKSEGGADDVQNIILTSSYEGDQISNIELSSYDNLSKITPINLEQADAPDSVIEKDMFLEDYSVRKSDLLERRKEQNREKNKDEL